MNPMVPRAAPPPMLLMLSVTASNKETSLRSPEAFLTNATLSPVIIQRSWRDAFIIPSHLLFVLAIKRPNEKDDTINRDHLAPLLLVIGGLWRTSIIDLERKT